MFIWYRCSFCLLVQLAAYCEHKHAVNGERAFLFPTKKIATQCRDFIQDRSKALGKPVSARLVHLNINPEDDVNTEVHIVLLPGDSFAIGKEFWQHTGMGISSRFAERCLSLLPDANKVAVPPASASKRYSKGGFTKHYSSLSNGTAISPSAIKTTFNDAEEDPSTYLEERYGRNLPLSAAQFAKRALRRRLAGVLLCDSVPSCHKKAGEEDLVVGPSTRGVTEVSENDVYLYPSGMSAIWSAHQLALSALPPAKSICFG